MDVVVTVPKSFGWQTWIAEGDAPGSEWSGLESHFWLGGGRPKIEPGDRVYVVFNGSVRGYAPLVRIEQTVAALKRWALVRRGGAVAMTIPQEVKGFRGWRYRWWNRDDEVEFPLWHAPSAAYPWHGGPVLETAGAP